MEKFTTYDVVCSESYVVNFPLHREDISKNTPYVVEKFTTYDVVCSESYVVESKGACWPDMLPYIRCP